MTTQPEPKPEEQTGATVPTAKTLEVMTGQLEEIQRTVTEKVEGDGLMREEVDRLSAAVTDIQEGQRKLKREALLRSGNGEVRVVVTEGPYAGLDALDVALLRKFAHSQARESYSADWIERADAAWRNIAESMTPDLINESGATAEQRLRDFHTFEPEMGVPRRRETGQWKEQRAGLAELTNRARAAMDSTTASSGDELVATLQARELWMDVNLQTLVAGIIPTFTMPSNPFDVPRQLGDVNWYPGTENVATTSTALTTGRTTLTAYELVAQVPYSFSLEEDAIIAMLPEIRASLVRNTAEILDDIILNADTTTTNNINADGATIAKTDAGKGHWLLGYDGLIHLPLIDNTGQANAHGAAVSDDMYNEIRAKLGKYGARPSELVWIMDVNTFIRSQSITAFRTMDKLGPNATLLTGMLGAIEGIPVIVSEQMLLTAADGKVTDGTAGTVGRLLIANRTQWAQGFRRELTVDVDRDTQKRQTVVTVSFRHALAERSGTRSSATHTGLQYNITGVS